MWSHQWQQESENQQQSKEPEAGWLSQETEVQMEPEGPPEHSAAQEKEKVPH